jgi:hypothetical protein
MGNIGQVLKKISSGKLFVSGVLVATVLAFATTNVASAAPTYFDVEKPSSTSQCNGSTTTYSWEWQWGNNNGGPWWLSFFFGGFVKVEHKTPNWEKLGFSSKAQCIRYVSTPAPDSRADCRNGGWYGLGFKNQNQCIRYLRLNGGGGYGA